jgi:hypothetical protein
MICWKEKMYYLRLPNLYLETLRARDGRIKLPHLLAKGIIGVVSPALFI